MKINIDEILKKQGKTRYWLAKHVTLTYINLMKLANNETSSIKFKNIEEICIALQCTPSDLFTIEATEAETEQ